MQLPMNLNSDFTEIVLSRPVTAFKEEFIDCFKDFILEVNVLGLGSTAFQDPFPVEMGALSIVGVSALLDGVIAILAAVGLLSSVTAAAIAIPIAIAGAIASYAYNKFQEIKKQKQFQQAEQVLRREYLLIEIVVIADLLIRLYQVQLENCTVKDAIKLAKACFKNISSEILNNKEFDFNELLYVASLQGFFLRTVSQMPNETLSMNIKADLNFTTKEMVMMPALYCKESNKFYKCDMSKPRQYGFLFFERQQDVDDFRAIVKKQKNNSKWNYQDMNATEVALLMNNSIFQVLSERKGEGEGALTLSLSAS